MSARRHMLIVLVAATTVLAWAAQRSFANINLEWRTTPQTRTVGQVVSLGLFCVSDDATTQEWSSLDLVFEWDPAHLMFQGVDDAGGAPLMASGFDAGSALNEVIPPQDGNGHYVAWADFGSSVAATPAGTLVTTFNFLAVSSTVSPTQVRMMAGPLLGDETLVGAAGTAGVDVCGTLGSASITVNVPEPGTLALVLLSLLTVRRHGRLT